MATKTADAGHDYVQPRGNPQQGLVTMISNYVANGATISSGDVFWMCKVPHGATITDMRAWGRSSGTGGIVFNVGTTTSATLFGPFTISATHQFVGLTGGASATQQFPFLVSLSDDAAVRHVTLAFTMASGTATATGSFGLMVSYTMPGQGTPF